MAETESTQTWVSTGRGGAGNFPYTPRALAKRPVTMTAPQGREVDYRRQSIARSGRNGVGFWGPTPDETTKQTEAQEFERDQKVIKERAERRQSVLEDGPGVVKSGRGGAGNISSHADQQPRLPTTRAEGEILSRVHSNGIGGTNYRFGDAIPMVNMNRAESAERAEAKDKIPSSPTANTESGLTAVVGRVSAFLAALTPAENRIENMSPISPSSYSRRTSINTSAGRGGAGNYGYATYKPSSSRPSPISPGTSSNIPDQNTPSSSRYLSSNSDSNGDYSATEHGYGYDSEFPVASTSSASTSRV